LTVSQLAMALGVKAHWVYHLIRRGQISVTRDPATRLYLFPDRPDTLETFRRLQHGHITHLRV
jgi:plasmid maintenance system antidote protein VapI